MNFYTADPHLFHEAIIRMCNRPFATVDAMNEAIISRAAECMTRKDDLWIIGDLAFAKGEQRDLVRAMLDRIPGRKHLVRGNHDKTWVDALGWHSIQPTAEIKDGGRRISLHHYPLVTWPGIRHGALHFFGHVHDNWLGHRNAVNVGVDFWDFRPVTMEQAAARAATLPFSAPQLACEPGLEASLENRAVTVQGAGE